MAPVPSANDRREQLEAEARTWIKQLLGESALGTGTLHEELKSGVTLCHLINRVQPGCTVPPSVSDKPFKQMENIGAYLDACSRIGVPAADTFHTVDLFEAKDIAQVVSQIHALGRVLQKQGFDGPSLGARMSTESRRTFSAETLRAGDNAAPLANSGAAGRPRARLPGGGWRGGSGDELGSSAAPTGPVEALMANEAAAEVRRRRGEEERRRGDEERRREREQREAVAAAEADEARGKR